MGHFSLDSQNSCRYRGAQGRERGFFCCSAGEGDGHHGLDEGEDGVRNGVLGDHGDNSCGYGDHCRA